MIEKARKFAGKAHAGQIRNYTGLPYITHPESVARLVSAQGYSDTIIAAAWLHDVGEDANIQIERIAAEFGLTVALLVENVTDKSKPVDGNRKTRKAIDLEHLSRAFPAAQSIKLADIIDNVGSIAIHAPKFAKTYLKEKEEQLKVLQDGNPHLRKLAFEKIQSAYMQLRGK